MNSKAKVFSLLAGISSLSLALLQIIHIGIYKYEMSSATAFWLLMWIAVGVFFIIGKCKIGTLVALAVYSVLELIDVVRYFSLSNVLLLFTALALTALAVLHLANVKAVKYLSFIPIGIFFIYMFVFFLRNIHIFEFLRYNWYALLHIMIEEVLYVFVGLFYLFADVKAASAPVSNMRYGYIPIGTPCINCGAVNPAGTKFCSSCGKPVQNKKFCPKCGKENPVESNFCVFCGNVFANKQ